MGLEVALWKFGQRQEDGKWKMLITREKIAGEQGKFVGHKTRSGFHIFLTPEHFLLF